MKNAICASVTAGHAQVDRRVCALGCAHNGMQHVPRDAHIFHMNIHCAHIKKHVSAWPGMHLNLAWAADVGGSGTHPFGYVTRLKCRHYV